MHADHPQPNDLSDLESRLAAWKPAAQGLDADRMLYAAGRASAQPSRARSYWQGISLLLTVVVVVLGIELMRERSERDALWADHRSSVPSSPREATVAPEPNRVARAEPLAPASLFAARRALTAGIDAWKSTEAPTPTGSESPAQPILQAWQAERLLER